MTPIDWLSIETEFRKGIESNRKIGDRFGVSEASIRRRAKKYGWVRDGATIKRERVKAHFAGKAEPDIVGQPKAVAEAIMEAADEDIRDMDMGLQNARLALQLVNKTLRTIKMDERSIRMLMLDAKNLKLLTDTNRTNIDIIRRIRGLDDPNRKDDDMTETELDARIAELSKKL
ncbi:hypothetical protein K6Q96_09090 [Grimontia kaedaensis]|uniref:Terminase n=1 Tax=Grimontia kaedaensis TaxID=2872157 RepID=A0ABY4WNF0_9GAMM|nr:hypothetical protein [Grimontia kaedaensis]USH01096.1 hypothetical protein K6Q96_09090 [Grimontia kaedaensis]